MLFVIEPEASSLLSKYRFQTEDYAKLMMFLLEKIKQNKLHKTANST